jgi:phosphoribosyl-AMP cyclohydrolase
MNIISDIIIDTVLEQLHFNEQGLIPAIAQDANTLEILMMAWQNRDAVRATLREQIGVYYSRSRQALWRKGETSGHTQKLVAFRFDCDKDCVVMLVNQTGSACHTNRRSCFYTQVTPSGTEIIIDNA